MITHATIVPLIGGATIGQSKALGSKPSWFASYSPFASNDQHTRNYYPDVPYHILDQGDKPTKQVDIINTVCPCAGLSTLNQKSSGEQEANKWMYETTRFGLGMNPKMMWGENAPGLMTIKGTVVRDKLKELANEFGYELYYFKLNANEHGLAQNRPRTHYLFSKLPPPISIKTRDEVDVADLIMSMYGHNEKFDDHSTPNSATAYSKPSEDAFYLAYKALIPEANTRKKITARLWMEKRHHSFWHGELQDFMKKLGDDYRIEGRSAYEFVEHFAPKILGGSLTFYRGTVFTNGKEIPALINNQRWLHHPQDDRFCSYRELMGLMGMPMDFELIDCKKNLNHISQNVPVNVAEDFVKSLV